MKKKKLKKLNKKLTSLIQLTQAIRHTQLRTKPKVARIGRRFHPSPFRENKIDLMYNRISNLLDTLSVKLMNTDPVKPPNPIEPIDELLKSMD